MDPRGTVLIIDDEESILEVIDEYLSERGFATATAATGEAARSLVAERSFDVALVDLKLPDTDGLDLVEEISRRRPETRCVIMTGFASMESTIEALRLNVFDYVIKPFQMVKIAEVVEAAVDHVVMKRTGAKLISQLEQANRRLEKSKNDLSVRILRANEELGEANESLKRHVTRLKMLYQMGRDISSNEDWSDSLDRFLMALCRYLGADGAGLLLFSGGGSSLKVRASYQLEVEWIAGAVETLAGTQRSDELMTEVFSLESCREGSPSSCAGRKKAWSDTSIPLLYKGVWLGFLLVRKLYRSRKAYLNDYHFLTTIQTILTEEVANAVNISRLRHLKDFNETILENINSGVLTTDRDGRIVFLNSRAREVLGRDGATEHFDVFFENPYGQGSLFDRLAGGEERNATIEGALVREGGWRVPVRLSTTVVETDDYHGRTVVAVFEDLTAQRAMEEELRRADRLRSLGELSAGVAHEIRNPLTGIATTAQVLRERLAGDGENVKYITVILDEIKRLDDIIRNLLTFARPTQPRPAAVSLAEVIESALALVADDAAGSGVAVSFESEIEDDSCLLDRDQVKQVILNIAMNGVQACDRGGALSVRLAEAPDRAFVAVTVADTGEGIGPEAADKLYNPFFTTRPEGTGLGLSISRKIVEAHGGRLFHESEQGRGTTFYIELPRRLAVSAAAGNG
ncbi:MAG: response regulator [Candidatus Krumholzibacteriota bacterium]|nr:response regulator [Candidatus Krumholzibacteriota bacterium]